MEGEAGRRHIKLFMSQARYSMAQADDRNLLVDPHVAELVLLATSTCSAGCI
jgi:hypothetical protein